MNIRAHIVLKDEDSGFVTKPVEATIEYDSTDNRDVVANVILDAFDKATQELLKKAEEEI